MSIEADFNSPQEAVATYYGDDGPDDHDSPHDDHDSPHDDDDEMGRWGEVLEESTDWLGGWVLLYQENLDTANVRWFVFRVTQDGWQTLDDSATPQTYPENTEFGQLDNFGSESAARSAYQEWLDQADDPEGDDGNGEDGPVWSDWEDVEEIEGWIIHERQHLEDDRTEYLVAGLNGNDETIFLAPDGMVESDPYIFETFDAALEAIEAFLIRRENGEPTPGEEPTGGTPDDGRFPGDGSRSSGPLGPAVDAVGGRRNALLLLLVAVAVIYHLERQGHIDLSGRWDDLTGGTQ